MGKAHAFSIHRTGMVIPILEHSVNGSCYYQYITHLPSCASSPYGRQLHGLELRVYVRIVLASLGSRKRGRGVSIKCLFGILILLLGLGSAMWARIF